MNLDSGATAKELLQALAEAKIARNMKILAERAAKGVEWPECPPFNGEAWECSNITHITGIAIYRGVNDFYKPLRDFYTPFTPFYGSLRPFTNHLLQNNNTNQRLYLFGFGAITLKIRLLKLIFSKAHAHEKF
jgi:hypothetical protein